MGISGLLPFLKKSSSNTHVREFKGCTVAVDAYCWLHKGAFSCADKLVKGEKTDAYVTYCMKLVNMLLSYDIKPILVFDGQHLPSKLVTEVKRRENRERYKIQAREFLRQGNTSKARECFQRCVDVTSAMALQLIKACRAKNVDCIVAPYEADAQLAFLNLQGIADIVITEDSDLLAFGCHRVFFKMDQNGSGVLIEKNKLYLSLGGRAEFFNTDKFRHMCILSGCDYLPSLPGIGLGKAFKFFSRSTSGDINSVLCRIPGCLNMPQLEVTSEYRDAFVKADQTFLYQLVYDPINRRLGPLHPYPDDIDLKLLTYAGKYMEDKLAFQLAIGNLDVQTLEAMDHYDPDAAGVKAHSIWSKNYSKSIRISESIQIKREGVQKHVISRQTSTRVDVALVSDQLSSEVLALTELTDRYIKKEVPTSPVLSSRKRKRSSRNGAEENDRGSARNSEEWSSQESSEGSQTTDSGLASFGSAETSTESETRVVESPPDRKRFNPFVKAKSPMQISASSSPNSNEAQFSALKTFSQLRKRTVDGKEIVTSAYFERQMSCVDKSGSNVSCRQVVNEEINEIKGLAGPIDHTPVLLPLKPILIDSTREVAMDSPKAASGCRPSGLSRQTPKATPKSAAAAVPGGMRQLNLREMFGSKS